MASTRPRTSANPNPDPRAVGRRSGPAGAGEQVALDSRVHPGALVGDDHPDLASRGRVDAHQDRRGAVGEPVLDQVGDHLLEPAGIGQHLDTGRDPDLDGTRVGNRRQGVVHDPRQIDGPGVEDELRRLKTGDVVEVVGQPRDPLGHAPDGAAHPRHLVGRQLVGVGLEVGPLGQQGRQRRAEIAGHEVEELALVSLEVERCRQVLDHPLEAEQLVEVVARGGLDLEDPPGPVSPHDGEPPLRRRVRHERLHRLRRVGGHDHLRQRLLVEVVDRPSEDGTERAVRVLDLAVEVDLVDAVGGVLDDVLVASLRISSSRLTCAAQ